MYGIHLGLFYSSPATLLLMLFVSLGFFPRARHLFSLLILLPPSFGAWSGKKGRAARRARVTITQKFCRCGGRVDREISSATRVVRASLIAFYLPRGSFSSAALKTVSYLRGKNVWVPGFCPVLEMAERSELGNYGWPAIFLLWRVLELKFLGGEVVFSQLLSVDVILNLKG